MTHVYLLQSIFDPSKRYTGFTGHLKARIEAHKQGKVRSTSRHRPWRLVSYIAFSEETRAAALETYLKTGSGRAFARKHLF